MFQEIAFISNIMDLFKDDWGPDISLRFKSLKTFNFFELAYSNPVQQSLNVNGSVRGI